MIHLSLDTVPCDYGLVRPRPHASHAPFCNPNKLLRSIAAAGVNKCWRVVSICCCGSAGTMPCQRQSRHSFRKRGRASPNNSPPHALSSQSHAHQSHGAPLLSPLLLDEGLLAQSVELHSHALQMDRPDALAGPAQQGIKCK
eukprot:GHUV01058759.1.p1 GENE.GHUV01058759.1~~GHUV01058759.1.p1  ORF type:complete len:142 (+),score=11.38 GHUV01058759.1:73-498(+)